MRLWLDLIPITTWFTHVTVRSGLESRNSLERGLDRRSNSAHRGVSGQPRLPRVLIDGCQEQHLQIVRPAAMAAPLGRGGDDGASMALTVARRAGYSGNWHAGPRSMIEASRTPSRPTGRKTLAVDDVLITLSKGCARGPTPSPAEQAVDRVSRCRCSTHSPCSRRLGAATLEGRLGRRDRERARG